MGQNIRIEKTSTPKQKPDLSNPGFGKFFTDHMFIMDYDPENGWNDARIVPYQPFSVEPSLMTIHYGQSVFEGLKAYKSDDGKTLLFRPKQNLKRLNQTNERMCIPQFDEDFVFNAIKELVKLDDDWIPCAEFTSLYIRPFVFATDPFLGVRPSSTYKFMVILSPVGAYYPEGMNPVSIYVETEYVRAIRGGVGFAKTSGNYAAGLKAQSIAKANGFTQVLWLDGVERKYVEEVGTMNIFFKIDGKVITPELSGSILDGITRRSCIQMLKSWGVEVVERKISIDEVFESVKNGTLEEAFGSGTAAVISPIGSLCWNDQNVTIADGGIGELSAKLFDAITGVQYGRQKDSFGWIESVD